MRVLLYTPSYTIDRDGQSLRLTKFAYALSLRGWHFDIITTPVFFLHDQSLCTRLRLLHYEVPYVRVFLTDPSPIATLRYRLHRNGRRASEVATPEDRVEPQDALGVGLRRRLLRLANRGYDHIFFSRIGDPDWIVPAISQGLRLLLSRSYRLVFASASSYFVSNAAAAIVSTVGRLPLILDYGDPWTPGPPARAKRLDRFLEAAVLRRAAKVVVTNGAAREAMLASYPFASPDRVSVITQGYDDDSNCPVRRGDCEQFTVAYTGSVYPGLQSLLEFLKAVRAARAEGIVVRFLRAGPQLPKDDTDQIERTDLGSVIQELGNLSRVDALAVQRKAALLLAVGHKSRDQIPGKTIEYIGARRPILSLSQGPYDLAANLVREHGLGIVVPNEAESILKALRQLHDLWRRGQLETIYHPRDVERFTWQHLAHRLEDIFRDAGGDNLQDREVCSRSADEHGTGEDVEHPLRHGVMRRGH